MLYTNQDEEKKVFMIIESNNANYKTFNSDQYSCLQNLYNELSKKDY